jgi:hypothetical protein
MYENVTGFPLVLSAIIVGTFVYWVFGGLIYTIYIFIRDGDI